LRWLWHRKTRQTLEDLAGGIVAQRQAQLSRSPGWRLEVLALAQHVVREATQYVVTQAGHGITMPCPACVIR
jgi:hypothetical protein